MKSKYWFVVAVTLSLFALGSINAHSFGFADYRDEASGLALKLPQGWQVSFNNGTLCASDPSDQNSKVTFTFINNVTSKINAVGVADLFIRKLKALHADFMFSPRVSKDADFVEMDCSHTDHASDQAVTGYYFVILEKGNGLFAGFEAADEKFDEQKDMLSQILVSLEIPDGLEEPSAENTGSSDSNQLIRLITRSGNGSIIDVPEDWSVTAFGSPGNLIAMDAEGTSGFIGQTVVVFSNAMADYAGENLVSDYLSPVEFLTDLYLPALGNEDIYLENVIDASAILQGAQGAEAKAALFTCTNGNGVRQKTLALALTLSPSQITGNWSALVYGFWTPEDQFDSRYTLMTRIAKSYKPNEDEISRVTAENLEAYTLGIKQLMQSLSSQLENSYQPLNGGSSSDGISSDDRLYQKWNDYAAGEERLYSEIEDKVYALPSGYDRYNNPLYSYEELSPITNDQWDREVDRSYLPGGWNH